MIASTSQFLRKHFVPHADNDHRPHALRHGALFAYGVGLITLKALVISLAILLPSASVYSSAITASNVIALTNQARQAQNLETLTSNSLLASAARSKAEDMVLNEYFAHTSPDGLTPWYWIGNAGYRYQIAGENLAVHFTSAESMQQSWLASPSHRDNIMNERFEETGVGIARGVFEDFDTTFVVQMFGQPPTPIAAVPIEETVPIAPAVTDDSQQPVVAKTELATFTPDSAAKEDVLVEEIAPSTIQINPASVQVIPQNDEYKVVAEVPQAETVRAVLGSEATDLVKTPNQDDTWSGSIPFGASEDSLAGGHLYLVAADQEQEIIQEVVVAAPATNPSAVFSLSQSSEYKLLGFIPLQVFNNTATYFFIIAIFILGGLLLLNTVVKVHHQKHGTLAHMLVLIILSGVLAVL